VWCRLDLKPAAFGREPDRTTRWAVPKEPSLVPRREGGNESGQNSRGENQTPAEREEREGKWGRPLRSRTSR
jgi:hypothetical protein